MIKMKPFGNRNGYTLLELTITIGILGIILVFMSRLLSTNIRLLKHEDSMVEYGQNARMASMYISKCIKESNTEVSGDERIYLIDINGANVLKTVDDQTTDNIIVDLGKRETNIYGARIWYYFEPDKFGSGNGYGELRDENDRTLASHIRNVVITDKDDNGNILPYLRVEVQVGKRSTDTTKIVFCINKNSG